MDVCGWCRLPRRPRPLPCLNMFDLWMGLTWFESGREVFIGGKCVLPYHVGYFKKERKCIAVCYKHQRGTWPPPPSHPHLTWFEFWGGWWSNTEQDREESMLCQLIMSCHHTFHLPQHVTPSPRFLPGYLGQNFENPPTP